MKRIVLLLLSAGMAFTSSAQVLIGPKIGVNFATLRAIKIEGAAKDAINDNLGYKTGMQFGVALHKGINETVGFQTELLFSQLGAELTIPGTAASTGVEAIPEQVVKIKNSYLQLPVMVKFAFGDEDFNFFLNAGPYLGFWTAQEYDDEEPEDFTDQQNRWDVGLNGGAGIGFDAGPGQLILEGRYGFGLLSLQNDNNEADITNRAISVSLGYLFGNVNDE
jgi:hypothetical protein